MNNISLPTVMALSCLISFLIGFFYLTLLKTLRLEKISTTCVFLAISYGCYALRLLYQLLANYGAPFVSRVNEILYIGWVCALWLGVCAYGRTKTLHAPLWVVPAMLVIWNLAAHGIGISPLWRTIPQHFAGAALFGLAGLHLWRLHRERDNSGLAALAVLLWLHGLSTATYPFTRDTWFAPYGFSIFALMSPAIGMGLLLAMLIDNTHELLTEMHIRKLAEEALHLQTVDLEAEVGERHRAEEVLQRLNRELRAISNCNLALMKAEDEQTLLNEICRIICEEAGYRLAWVGYPEYDESKTLRITAWGGLDDGYLANAHITWADTERGRGPGGTAIRTGRTAWIQDFATDPLAAPWRENALQRGYRSCICLPLKNENAEVLGALCIYSTEPNAFTPDEIRLLEELAGDLAFGIQTLRNRNARKESERNIALLSFALDNVREAAYLIDEQARFLYVNEESCRVLGYGRDELLTLSVPDIGSDFPVERWLAHWAELKKDGSLTFEDRHKTKDGRAFPVEISANYLKYDGQGYNLALARDITERKRAEETLRLKTVELKAEVAERQAAQENLQEQALLLENEMEERRQAQEKLEALNESLEERVKRRTDELEQANVRLQELDRMKSMFIASMSHELRTPLNSIIGFSRILIEEWLGPLNGEQKENLATVLRSGKHLLSLINDVIDVSKIEAGLIEVVPDDFDIFDVVSEVAKSFENDVCEKGVELTVQAMHHSMHTDRKRLLQCLLNLVGNAVKYTEKGTITVCARLANDGGDVELSVTDSGIGMHEDDIGKLFSPFVRLESYLKSTVPGTGLGLYLTQKLVKEVLRGDITVTSAMGEGSRFVLTAPVNLLTA